MDDEELLKSAGLYGRDIATGEEGYNLAAIMLLGKDDVILNVAPAYVTDALVRKVNIDRYDDREIIKTNLIESYEMLLEFGRKHLLDKFFLEDTVNKSLRNTIVREMVSNTLMHREFSSSYTSKFVIERERMYVENANRSANVGYITVDNLEPNPKNPIIAAFFRNIGYADQLGSGARNLFKYSKYYSGQDPKLIEGDIFRIIVPLNDDYSFDFSQYGQKNQSNHFDQSDQLNQTDLSEDEIILLNLIKEHPDMTNSLLAETLGWSISRVKYYIQKLKKSEKIKRKGTNRSGKWDVL